MKTPAVQTILTAGVLFGITEVYESVQRFTPYCIRLAMASRNCSLLSTLASPSYS